MDRIEQRQDGVEKEVRTLAATIGRVEVNQEHAAEVNKIRLDALDAGIKLVSVQVTDFMRRIDGMITGEVETAQSRSGRELVADYKKWREGIDKDRESQAVLNGQVRILGRLAVILVSSNLLAIAAAVYAITQPWA
jgi:hypothetical protein